LANTNKKKESNKILVEFTMKPLSVLNLPKKYNGKKVFLAWKKGKLKEHFHTGYVTVENGTAQWLSEIKSFTAQITQTSYSEGVRHFAKKIYESFFGTRGE